DMFTMCVPSKKMCVSLDNYVACKTDDIYKYESIDDVRSALNIEYGTEIDFEFLSKEEGYQIRHGYLPMNKKKVICGQSGITIATGFDIGQNNRKDLESYHFSSDLEGKLMPFVGAKKEDARKMLPLAKKTILTKKEANEIDFKAKGRHIKAAVNSWNKSRLENTPMFNELTPAQQTVLLSRTFHQGLGMPKTRVAQKFYQAALKNDWISAENNLRNYNVKEQWYKDRVSNEANLLKNERLKK
ncbi:MAG: pesticin C-terminus-like muramidase, partial [Erysipelotrichaceae bacterium]